MQIKGFLPIETSEAEVLILGSIPSVRSLEENQYYGHPGNAFWSIMGELLGFDRNLDYEKRKQFLINNKIALWDVLKSCSRQGSLDSAIKSDSVITNDFRSFFDNHPKIRKVFFNGTTAQKEYNKKVLPIIDVNYPNLEYFLLPSTSPAMASLTKVKKLEKWKILK